MKAIYKIPSDSGIMEISGQSGRPTIKINPEDFAYINEPWTPKVFNWLPLEINFDGLTTEQKDYLQQKYDLYKPSTGRMGYGGPIKFGIQIEAAEEVWTLQGCYVTKVEGDTIVIEFDRALANFDN